jgi:hypothetical protein
VSGDIVTLMGIDGCRTGAQQASGLHVAGAGPLRIRRMPAVWLAPANKQTEDGGMTTSVDEFPKHPFPHVPPSPEPQRPQMPPPTVFVYERQGWEYKVVTRSASGDAMPEDELNALGHDGWELVGVVPLADTVRFYLKRLRG